LSPLALAVVLTVSVAGCAQEKYYEITDRQSGAVTYSTTPPPGDSPAGPDVPGAKGLVGRSSGRAVNQQYIVREITKREYQQRTAKAPAGDVP
jgi:hypothetical protein